jgi:hypothetical protein
MLALCLLSFPLLPVCLSIYLKPTFLQDLAQILLLRLGFRGCSLDYTHLIWWDYKSEPLAPGLRS